MGKPKPVRKQPARRAPSKEWDMAEEEDGDEEEADASDDDHQDVSKQNRLSIQAPDVDEQSLLDLHDMAERVGEEVDRFAETLDRYNDRLRGPQSYQAAHELCIAYRDHGNGVVSKLKKQHQMQRLKEMKNSFAARAQTSTFGQSRAAESETAIDSQGLKALKKWQAETDTWELFRIMLEIRYNPDQEAFKAAKGAQLETLGAPHRYSSATDLWSRFTIENDAAKEIDLVKKWLEEAADHAQSDVTSMAEELEKRSGRQGGLWLNGWMETREKIKNAKRMRLGDSSSLDVRRSDNNDLVVSELDPDAPSRQKRKLEKGDTFAERSLWMTCWEMLRRGKPWAEVCDWCSERNQSWRAISMGFAADKEVGLSGSTPGAEVLWRRMCAIAAKSSNADEYEAAVYGLLSGDLETVQKVCKTWDDFLFAHYNTSLKTRYDQYILQHNSLELSSDFLRKHGIMNSLTQTPSANHLADIRKVLNRLSITSDTSREAKTAMKLIQSSLLGDTFAHLCQQVGTAISDAAWFEATSTVIRPVRTAVSPVDAQALPHAAISEDYSALRIVTHMLIMLREFHPDLAQSSESDAVDNVVAAYVQLLRASGMRDLTPLYASKMQSERGTASLAQVISDIADPQESIDFIKLMEVYDIDAVAVLNGQYRYLLDQLLGSSKSSAPQMSIIEPTKEELYPGQVVRLGFLHDAIDEKEDALVNSLSVFFLIEGHWSVTFEALSYTCRKLLSKFQALLFGVRPSTDTP